MRGPQKQPNARPEVTSVRCYKLQLQLRMIEVDEPEALPASPDMPELPPEDHDPVRRDESQISRLTAIQERMLRNMEKGPTGFAFPRPPAPPTGIIEVRRWFDVPCETLREASEIMHSVELAAEKLGAPASEPEQNGFFPCPPSRLVG